MKPMAAAALLLTLTAQAAPAPEHVPVFTRGQDGYHTYRIPALCVAADGTVLAFCEGRKHSGADHGDIDLLLKRSADGGKSWSAQQIVWEDGAHTIGNPAPVLDNTTGVVWLLFCRDNDRVFVTHSADHGASWANPREITADVKRPEWGWYATGPVHGIQLDSGRLLIPCDHGLKTSKKARFSHAVLSDDHGKTWRIGGVIGDVMNECTAVQTADGRVYMNMRNYAKKGRRAYAWSNDGGETWGPPAWDDALVGPVCQAAVAAWDPAPGPRRILFSNPASAKRRNLTLRVSDDQCRTWAINRVLWPGPAAYSDLAVLDDGAILCLYERGIATPYETITLARCAPNWLEKNE